MNNSKKLALAIIDGLTENREKGNLDLDWGYRSDNIIKVCMKSGRKYVIEVRLEK